MSTFFEFWKNAIRDQTFTMTVEALKDRLIEWLNGLPEPEKEPLAYYDNKLIVRMFLGDQRHPGLSSDYPEAQFHLITKELVPIIQEWKASRRS